MGTFSVGTLSTGGCTYSCTISYDDPTRSGDDITIKNVKATITSTSQYQTQNRIAVTVSINGANTAGNWTVLSANDTSYPTSKEITIVGADGYTFSCLSTSFSISATFRSTGYGYDWNNDFGSASKSGSITCPARTYSVTFSANGGSGAPSSQTKTYNVNLTLSSTVPTYSGFAFKGWSGSDGNTYQAGGSYSGNANLSLTAIWQALTTDLDDVANCEIGAKPSFSWTPQASSLTYKLILTLSGWSWTSSSISPGSTSKYTYNSYTLPLEVCNQLPTQTSGLMKVDLETYNGGTKTGTSTKYFTVTVPSSVTPSFSSHSATLAEDNSLHVFLQNYSKVKGTAVISKAYSSDITSVTMTVGSDTKQATRTPATSSTVNAEAVSGILSNTGSITVTFTAVDARGRSSTATDTITVYSYDEPTVTVDLQASSQILVDVVPGYSTVGGINSATCVLNNEQPVTVVNGQEYQWAYPWTYPDSRNFTASVTVTDAVSSTTVVKQLYPGRGDRFQTLSEDEYYVGIDDKGWKDTASDYEGGIDGNGIIWFKRRSGDSPIGVGLPAQLEPNTDYELIYATNQAGSDTVMFISFFKAGEPASEMNTSYISTIPDDHYMPSGTIFRTPDIDEGALWAILTFGVAPKDYAVTDVGYQEFSGIVLREVTDTQEDFAWELETGTLGLDTPNQKYISRIQMRVDYIGTLKAEIAYDNVEDSNYNTVHESESDHMRSITVPIKVKRNDHFRIRLSGVGQVKLYSLGYQTDEGSEICLI